MRGVVGGTAIATGCSVHARCKKPAIAARDVPKHRGARGRNAHNANRVGLSPDLYHLCRALVARNCLSLKEMVKCEQENALGGRSSWTVVDEVDEQQGEEGPWV